MHDFNNEYMLINDYHTLNRLFQIKRIDDFMGRLFESGIGMFVFSDYTK